MGFLKNILGGKKKEPISLIEFVKVLASWAADLNSIRENVELTTFPENVKRTLRNEIIYLQIFAIEMAVGFCFSPNMKEAIMEKFYKLLFSIFEGMQAYTKSDQDLRKTIEDGIDRTMGEYWVAVNDKECQGNPPLSVGKTFSFCCGYPNDYDITTLGADLFDTCMRNITKIINNYDVEI